MKGLIDKEVTLEFVKESRDLMGNGFPVRAYVRGWDSPMVALESYWGGDRKWVNVSQVKWIRPAQESEPQCDE